MISQFTILSEESISKLEDIHFTKSLFEGLLFLLQKKLRMERNEKRYSLEYLFLF